MEIEDVRFEFGGGGPLADEATEWILFEEVDLTMASYLDRQSGRYFDVVWDEERSGWKEKDSCTLSRCHGVK